MLGALLVSLPGCSEPPGQHGVHGGASGATAPPVAMGGSQAGVGAAGNMPLWGGTIAPPPTTGGIHGPHPAQGALVLGIDALKSDVEPARLRELGLSVSEIRLRNDSTNPGDYPAMESTWVTPSAHYTMRFEAAPSGTYSEVSLKLGPVLRQGGGVSPAMQLQAELGDPQHLETVIVTTGNRTVPAPSPGGATSVTLRCRPGLYHAMGGETKLRLSLHTAPLLRALREAERPEPDPLTHVVRITEASSPVLVDQLVQLLADPSTWNLYCGS
ncbi:MAG: hypothetical protein MJD61_11765 [Proteobacteria bacterium]|nr:hypothetical protein [Pseudomonadota bacterium]